MSHAVINMNWDNGTQDTLSFNGDNNPEHGTPPTATPGTMNAAGSGTSTSTVSARSNSSVTGPGPEGTYYWQIAGGDKINVNYHHPFGTGETSVVVTCPSGYVAQGCGQGPAGTITLTSKNCSSLDDHSNSYCTISVTAS